MEIIKHEIFSQSESLMKTQELFAQKKADLLSFMNQPYAQLIFMGCGSGYMLCQGAAAMFSMHTPKKAAALAGGEVLIDPESYRGLFQNSLVIVASRSGETSEVILALEKMRTLASFSVLGIIAQNDCSMKKHLDFVLEIPWAFDQSVCQTRTISNIYYSLTMLCALYTGCDSLEESFDRFIRKQKDFLLDLKDDCEQISRIPWDNVTILADGTVRGIASEGGLAFTEICMIPGEYFNILDYRHGPVVLADEKKLIIILLNPREQQYQKTVIDDLKKRNSYIITAGTGSKESWGSDYHVALNPEDDFESWGIPFINLCQLLAFYKALALGHDPDAPEGLNPYIKF